MIKKIKNKKQKATFFVLGISLLLVASPLFCEAVSFGEFFEDFEKWFLEEERLLNSSVNTNSESQIMNKINVLVDTGGNVVTGGEIIEGEGKTKIEIKNVINGEEIDPIEIESEASEVSVESEIIVKDGVAQVQRETEIDSKATVENYEVELENERILGENLNTTNKGWWLGFMEDLKSFFENIFNLF